MKVLVTGATGFVGRALVERIADCRRAEQVRDLVHRHADFELVQLFLVEGIALLHILLVDQAAPGGAQQAAESNH